MNKSESMHRDGMLTEELILKAARSVFTKKGYQGARMQEIADEAQINKALLHYYFRSKDQLFDKVFKEAFKELWPSVEEVVHQQDLSAKKLLRVLVDGYMNIMEKTPFLPNFIVSEINRSPERVEELILSSGINPVQLTGILEESISRGEILPMDSRELLINTIALCIFPILIRPLAERLLWPDAQSYDQFLKSRRDSVYDFVCKSILIDPENQR